MAKILTEIVKCAVCGQKSEQKYIASSSFTETQDLDTRPYGNARDLLQYEIQECPHCGFVSFHLADNPNNVKLFDCSTNIISPSKIASGYIKLAQQFERADDLASAGYMYLRASWVFDDENKNEWALKYRKETARCFKTHVDNTEDGDVAMVLVDVYRRSNDFDEALDLIKQIGDTGYEDYNEILKYQAELCASKDASIHTMEEAEK